MTSSRVAPERVAELFEATKAWGRWGDDDQRGALNLLTAERSARAASLVRDGTVVSCGRPLPVAPAVDNPTPAQHHMIVAGDALPSHGLQASADFVGVAFHGMAVAHLDALCHVFVDGRMWNGFPATDVTSLGARRNSVAAAAAGVAGRGVLVDLPRHRGVGWLEPGEAVAPAELEAACDAQGVEVGPGDILLVSTGRDARRAEHGAWDPGTPGLAGLHAECIGWLHGRDVAVLGSDGVSDPLPAEQHAWPMPLHMCLLVGMGVHLLDNLDLSRLATACAAAGRWEFLFTLAPLHIKGGTGSPVNPLAIL